MPVKGTYLALTGIGAIFLWSGLKGKSWSEVLRSLIAGQNPSGVRTTSAITPIASPPVSGTSTGSGGAAGTSGSTPSSGSLNSMLNQLAQQKGWNAAQVACWHTLIGMEATGPKSTNSSSGAFGWAQALGHGGSGTSGCGRNQYGGFGLSDAQAQKANCGSGPEQLLWMANYIKATYGTPCAAVKFHLAHNYYLWRVLSKSEPRLHSWRVQ